MPTMPVGCRTYLEVAMHSRISLTIFLPLALSSCVQGEGRMATWGKVGVPFEQYRSDSIECAVAGATIPVEETEEYGEIDRGLKTQQRVLENPNTDQFDQIRDYSMTYKRNIRANVGDIQAIMVERVHVCLRSKGYKEFLLSTDQEAKLATLRKGTSARFRYLYSVASDPANVPPDLPDSIIPPDLTEDVNQ